MATNVPPEIIVLRAVTSPISALLEPTQNMRELLLSKVVSLAELTLTMICLV